MVVTRISSLNRHTPLLMESDVMSMSIWLFLIKFLALCFDHFIFMFSCSVRLEAKTTADVAYSFLLQLLAVCNIVLFYLSAVWKGAWSKLLYISDIQTCYLLSPTVVCCMYCVLLYHTRFSVHVRYSFHLYTSSSHTHTFFVLHTDPISAPESQTSPAFSHKLIFRAFGMLCPPLVCNIKFTLFMTERAIDVQMFPSLIRLEHIRLEWGLPVQMPVSETQWIFKTHSLPFILCCWNNNVSRAHRPPAWTSERICVLHLHDLPHFSIWDTKLHHLASSKQLKGFITWLARRQCRRVQQWHKAVIKDFLFFLIDGMFSFLTIGGESLTPSFTLPKFSHPVGGFEQATFESQCSLSHL